MQTLMSKIKDNNFDALISSLEKNQKPTPEAAPDIVMFFSHICLNATIPHKTSLPINVSISLPCINIQIG